jgi:cytochrome c oxidase cbb3-type subunit 3
MRCKWPALVVAALAMVGCQYQPAEVAPAGSAPAVDIPVGPIIGVAQQPPSPKMDPYAQDKVALAEGRKLFLQYNCYGCHGGHAGGGMGPSLRDATWIYGDSDAHVFDSIAQGRANGMPTWGKRIPEDQIWKLVAYIKSMRTPLEPDPPVER